MFQDIVILFFIFFLFIWVKVYKSKNCTLSSSLLILYAGSFLASIILCLFFVDQKILFIPVLFMIGLLLMWILPFKIDNDSIISLTYNEHKIKLFAWILILFLFPATLYYAYYSYLTITTVDLSQFRNNLTDNSLVPPNFIHTIFSHLSALYFFNIVLFFIALRDHWSKSITILLFISSFAFVFRTLTAAGRDGVIFWVFNFIILFIIFKNEITLTVKRMIIRFFIVFLVVLSSAFLTISIARFSNNTAEATKVVTYALVDYYGQQTENFGDVFYLETVNELSFFPGIHSLFNANYDDETSDIISDSLFAQLSTNDEAIVFGFFVKTIVWGNGYLGSIFISIIFILLLIYFKRKFDVNKDLFLFLIIYLLYQIPLDGVFYYRQGVGKMDFPYILGILLCLIFRLKLKKNL